MPWDSDFLAWQASGPKDVGSTISDALGRYRGSWPEASRSTLAARQGKAAGNGSLMRTLPVALAYADTDTMLRQSALLSAMTHWDAQAEVCCAIYCLWVQGLLAGATRHDAWRAALVHAKQMADRQTLLLPETPGPSPLPAGFWARWEAVEALPQARLQPNGYAGYVVDCLEAAAWWVLRADTLEGVLIGCVNLAGEADTIAAVAGGAAGAYWGAGAIPARWLEMLLARERIEATGDALARFRDLGE